MQRDQLDAVADRVSDPPAVRADLAGRGAGGIGSPFNSWPVRASHTFAVSSALPVTIRVPSGLNDTLCTATRVPFQFEQDRPRPRVPHLRRLVITAGDDPRAVRAERHAPHPVRVPFQFEQGVPVRASHTFAVRSSLPVTIRVPSGLNDTLDHRARVPFEVEQGVPVRASHTFAVLSSLPVTIRVPSGLNDTLRHHARVPFESSERRARPRVPHLRRPVLTAGDDPRAVRAERHATTPSPCAL